MAAAHVAYGLGEKPGGRIGHRMRHDDTTGPNTRVVYMTQGLMWRLLLRDPGLAGVACIVFDEFHERTLGTDVTLGALAHRRRQGLACPALLVMSATLAAEPVAKLLGDAPIVRVAGRRYPVAIDHIAHRSNDALEVQVARGVAQVAATPPPGGAHLGHVLTFLPGVRAIDRASAACAQVAARNGLVVAPLHASLPAQAQDAAVAPGGPRRLILATNVAETSLTIDGVTHVIDSGLANIAHEAPVTGISQLVTASISQAAATQRAGRAGRTGPGMCLRLYTGTDYRLRRAFETPEILRLDVTQALLWLSVLQLPSLAELPLLDRPSAGVIDLAEQTLMRLGAWRDGAATALGAKLLQLPLHPRLARVALAASTLGIAALGARAVAVLSEERPGPGSRQGPPAQGARQSGTSDLWELCGARALSPEAARVARDVQTALPRAQHSASAHTDPEDALTQALMAGFSDRLVRRMPPLGPRPGALPLALGWGGQGLLKATSCVRDSPLMLALAAGSAAGKAGTCEVRLAHSVAAEDLIALDDGRLIESVAVAVSAVHGRVEREERLVYDGLTLHEERHGRVSDAEAQAAIGTWLLAHPDALTQKLQQTPAYAECVGRLESVALDLPGGWAFAVEHDPIAPTPGLARQLDAAISACAVTAAAHCRSLADLQALPWLTLALETLLPPWRDALARAAPKELILPSGRRLPIAYVPGQPPSVGSFLQDFFGMARAPKVGSRGRALVLHLWGPNRRDLQVTQDLESFWRVHYPTLRRALARRYPRHAWPEDPMSATPPVPRSGRQKR